MDSTFYQQLAQLDGISQTKRLPSALQAPLTQVDHRSIPDLINALKRYAENIRFVNLANRTDGNWAVLFEQNPALVMASVMSVNTNRRREFFLTQQRRGLKAALVEWRTLLSEYDDWFARAEALMQPTARQVLFRAQHYAREYLQDALLNAFSFWRQTQPGRSVPWPNLLALVDDQAGYDDLIERDFSDFSRTEIEQFLQENYEAILHAFTLLAENAESAFNHLLQSSDHDPASGLLLAFLKVYQKTQQETNQFTDRLLHFYYESVLKNEPETATADRVILDCTLKPGALLVDVKKGALFSAGQTESHHELQYRTTKRTLLTGTILTGMQTIYLQRHVAISPGNISQSVTRVKAYDRFQTGFLPPMNLFGFESGARQKTIDLGHNIGLCIASDTLLMKEGQREISLEFSFSDNAVMRLDSAKNRYRLLLEEANNTALQGAPTLEYDTVRRLLDTLPSDHPVRPLVLSSQISAVKTAFLLSLIQALPSRLVQQTEVITALLKFLAQLDNEPLHQWLQGREGLSAELIKRSLLALYRSIRNVTLLGLVHFELLFRFLFFSSFLTTAEQKSIAVVLNEKQAETDQQRMHLDDMKADFSQSQYTVLSRYFQKAFECHLTQVDGWRVHRNYRIDQVRDQQAQREHGYFALTLRLDTDDGSVVPLDEKIHGSLHAPGRPVLMLRVNRYAPCYPLSWFGDISVSQAKLRVNVRGFKDISAHNEYGPVDRTKPFYPFSAVPKNDAQFYLGGFEFARKRVTQLTVKFHWKGLPKNFGGFNRYYEYYGSGYSNRGFNVNLTVLSHGELIPQQALLQQQYPLFCWHETTGILSAQSQLTYQVSPAYPRISPTMNRASYDNLALSSHGYLCLRLRSGEGVFGHKQYPTQLSQTLTHNARNKRKQRGLPNEPYTPEISQIEIDYQAEDNIELVSDYEAIHLRDAAQYGNKSIAYHVSPLGLSTVQTSMRAGCSALFPQLTHEGNLFIAFTPARSERQLNLYFQLANDSTHPVGGDTARIHWLYFSRTGWQPLATEHILSDSTEGLLHSGLVTLLLPDDAVSHPGFKPADQYWLCIGTAQPQYFASLMGLTFDAIEVQAVDTQYKASGLGHQWRALKDIAGLQSVEQKEPAFAGMASENEQESLVRLYERLRHKNRAITPWDYERIILERFPDVQLAKCLPNCRFNQASAAPGHVLIVLAPRANQSASMHGKGHHLNAVVLRRVCEFIKPLAPPSAKLDVINATYEYVQVRCAVRFSEIESQGEQTQQLQHDLSHYLSPWTDQGLVSHFSWSIQLKALEAYIRALPYVQEIARLSLVKCYGDHQSPEYFRLQDTAKGSVDGLNRVEHSDGFASLSSSYPWSLPLPARTHNIDVLTEGDENYFAQPVGISSLQIGTTFVIRSDSHYAEAK